MNHVAPALALVEVNFQNLAANVRRVKSLLSSDTSLMAVVKGNAYGHGAVASARVAIEHGADRLGVAFVTEGIELREQGIKAPIQVLGAWSADQAEHIVQYSLIPNLTSPAAARVLNEAARGSGSKVPVHLKIDTGLHRLGFLPDDAVMFARESKDLSHIEVEGIYTHMACADAGMVEPTEQQAQSFVAVADQIEDLGVPLRYRHVAATALIIDRKDLHFDMVRAGLMLYGYGQLPGQAASTGLIPCMTFKTQLMEIRRVPAGEGVGYSYSYVAQTDSLIGTIPVGYVDGLPYALGSKGEVLIRGQRARIAGRVCMDHTMLDLTQIDGAKVGDEVVIIGSQGQNGLWADSLAQAAGKPVEDILCGISRYRVKWINRR